MKTLFRITGAVLTIFQLIRAPPLLHIANFAVTFFSQEMNVAKLCHTLADLAQAVSGSFAV